MCSLLPYFLIVSENFILLFVCSQYRSKLKEVLITDLNLMVSRIIVSRFENVGYTHREGSEQVSFYNFVSRASQRAKNKRTNELKRERRHENHDEKNILKFDKLKYSETDKIFELNSSEHELEKILLKKSSTDNKYVICNPDDAIKTLASELFFFM